MPLDPSPPSALRGRRHFALATPDLAGIEIRLFDHFRIVADMETSPILSFRDITTPRTMNNTRLSFFVPVELVKTSEGFSLVFENQAHQQASVPLVADGDASVAGTILLTWAGEKLTEALLKRRRDTGVKDRNGVAVMEGDILLAHLDPPYGEATGVVAWVPDYASFVIRGRYAGDGMGGWQTLNLQDAYKYEVVGDVFRSPEKMKPAEVVAHPPEEDDGN